MTTISFTEWLSKTHQNFHRTFFAVVIATRVHYNDVITGAIASQITNLMIVYSTVYSSVDQRKHHSSASLAFVRGIRRWPVNSPHKRPVTRKMFPFDDVIMCVMLPDCHWPLLRLAWNSRKLLTQTLFSNGARRLDHYDVITSLAPRAQRSWRSKPNVIYSATRWGQIQVV